MSLGAIQLIVLVLILLGVLPTWGYSTGWGYGPTGLVGTVVVAVVLLLVFGAL
jgi:hypothetical protein